MRGWVAPIGGSVEVDLRGVRGGVALAGVAALPVDPDGDVPGDGDAVRFPRGPVVVVDGAVLGDAVVEHDELAGFPGHADHVLGTGDVFPEQAQDVGGLWGGRGTPR